MAKAEFEEINPLPGIEKLIEANEKPTRIVGVQSTRRGGTLGQPKAHYPTELIEKKWTLG